MIDNKMTIRWWEDTSLNRSSLKEHSSVFVVFDFLVVIESLSEFLAVKQSHSGDIIDSGELIFPEKVFWILPCRSISDQKYIKRKSVGLALLFESGVERSDILAIRAPVNALLIGFACEKHDAFGLLGNEVVEHFFSLLDWHFYHWRFCCRYFIANIFRRIKLFFISFITAFI